jgi:hypothetical protein
MHETFLYCVELAMGWEEARECVLRPIVVMLSKANVNLQWDPFGKQAHVALS